MSLPKPYYDEDGITLYHGDCLDILPHIEPGSIDLVLTDPPYGVNLDGKTHKNGKSSDGGYISIADDYDLINHVVLPAVKFCIDTFKRVVLTPGIRHCFKYPEPDEIGTIFYPSGSGLGRWGFICSQPILYYGKDPYLSKSLGCFPNSISTTEHAEKNGHPCPKPIMSWRWLLNRASLNGDTILDPFLGSGTTAVAAKNLGRRCIGIELEEKYLEIAVKRLAQQVFNF